MNVSVEEALREFQINFVKVPEHFKVLCPFHTDTNPSGTIHHKSGFFQCWSCGKKTSLVLYLVKHSNLPIFQVKRKLGLKSDCKNPHPATEIENYHIKIWEHKTFLDELHYRCITDELIRKYRLGVIDFGVEKRITIPILNEIGEYANIRMYIPGAADRKFINSSGKDRSRIRIYPIEQMEYDQLLVVGGEMKAIAGAEALNKYDIGCVTVTCGEQAWPDELTDRFANKLLYVNCDLDHPEHAELRCRKLKPVGREIHKLILTKEEVNGLEKGDINDFLRYGGNLYEKILNTPEWVLIPGGELEELPPEQVSFREAYSEKNVGKKVTFTGIVSAISNKIFFPAAEVEVHCTRDQPFCILCDVNSKAFSKETSMHIGNTHPALLALISEKTENHYKTYKESFRIPAKCRVCTFHPKQVYSVQEVRLEEQVEATSRQEPLTMKVGWMVNGPKNLLDAHSYHITGRLFPSPKNQEASFIASSCEPAQDALESFNPPGVEYFRIFQPSEWTLEGVRAKLDEIYSDLEANVTRIWRRREYHLALDLAYHSILHLDLGEIKDINGWVEILVVGDTAQGKSHAVRAIQAHYNLGKKIDCKNVTLAGLTIGLEPGQGKHFAVLGAMPRNDRGLLIYEELKGMKPQVFQALTEVRSSGFVQINKIESQIRRARCRGIAITNCVDTREVGSYTYGIESALGVIGTNEDLRRFDLVYIISKHDIKELPERQNPPKVEHRFTDDLCQKLVLKAWKCEEVKFEDVNGLIDATDKLISKFGHGPPVLDSNSSHIKIAKLSAALAARTCSYIDEILYVRKCHVEYIIEFLDKIYCSPAARLDEKSKAVRDSTLLRDKEGLIKFLKGITNAADIIIKLAESDAITSTFIKDLCGDFYIGQTLFARLIQSNALQRIKGDRYAKTPDFTKLLNETEFEIKRPDYLDKKGEDF